jgi:hypothetical protein
LWFAKRTNQTANRFLAMALTIAVLWITRILVIDIQSGKKSTFLKYSQSFFLKISMQVSFFGKK